jgi:opacity protein-like surface antigen
MGFKKTGEKLKTETMMRMKWMLTTFILIGMAALTSAAAHGQSGAPADEQNSTAPSHRTAPAATSKQTDVGISFYEAFTSGTSGNGTKQTPTNAPGGMLEIRHIANSLVGYEITYSFNPAKQAYAPNPGACLLTCQNPATTITANASQISNDYVVSHKYGNLRPFAVGGLGFFIVSPGATPYGNNTPVRPTYVYGGGVDWNVSAKFGVRLQYRGNYYKAPNISSIYPATGVLTQSAEPMGGVFYRF